MGENKLNIIMAASEMAPLAKVGGLADAVSALSKTLARRAHRVSVIIPCYSPPVDDNGGFHRLHSLAVPFGVSGSILCDVLEHQMGNTGVTVYQIKHDSYYMRNAIYGENGVDYADNDRRYAFLSRASLELIRHLGLAPDIIHVHDWHTAMVPVFMNSICRSEAQVSRAACILTIHNADHQGLFDKELINVLGVGWEHYTSEELEFFGRVNLLKGGIYHATSVNTVSPTYALEIKTHPFGHGIEGTLIQRAPDFCGILNGVDGDEWNPETDPHIAAPYSSENTDGKRLCKQDVQRVFGLPDDREAPLIGFVSRLVKQKGIDVIAEAIHRILGLGVRMVLLGTGEAWSHFYFGDIARDYPKVFACHIGFDNELAHKVIAGADFILMPSRFEPCGLTQMYGLRYGALPIVHATGGLIDTVEDFNEGSGCGTGFVFSPLSAGALYEAIARAVRIYRDDDQSMKFLMRRAMGRRFTWDRTAQAYEDLYDRAIRKIHAAGRDKDAVERK